MKNYSALLFLASIVLVSGCVSTGQSTLETAPANVELNIGLEQGYVAPDFILNDPEKGRVSKRDFSGKPLFIFFTTTWCVPCQIGAQNLARYDDETGGNAFNVLIVFVDPTETDSQLLAWRRRFGRNDWFVAKDNGMAEVYQVQYLDTKYVFDKKGIIRWKDLRPLDYASIKPVLEPIL